MVVPVRRSRTRIGTHSATCAGNPPRGSNAPVAPPLSTLKQLDAQDKLSLVAGAVVVREGDGHLAVKDEVGRGYEGTASAGVIGS